MRLDRDRRLLRISIDEISLRSRYFARGGGIDQMHFGGGTPTYLPKKRLTR